QPIYPSGWWSASLAQKSAQPLVERLEPDRLAALDTRYYNAAIHRAAFALPNFLRETLAK
ncbi:MAG: polyamine aminopropyltransferase, partial [Sinobacteraceae bacterium]|nr:polyamine aminopropyltransferase [Nevskiaceae bacterium]